MPFGINIETFAPLSRRQIEWLRLVRSATVIVVALLVILWLVIYVAAEIQWRNGETGYGNIYQIEHILVLAVLLVLVAGLAAHSRLLTGDAVTGGARSDRLLFLQQIIAVAITGIIVVSAYVVFGIAWNRGVFYPEWGQVISNVPVHSADMAMHSYQNYIARGRDQKANSDIAGAFKEFRAAVDVNPNAIDAHWELGWLYVEIGDNGAAIEEFGRVVSLSPGSERADQANAEIERLSVLFEP